MLFSAELMEIPDFPVEDELRREKRHFYYDTYPRYWRRRYLRPRCGDCCHRYCPPTED